MIIGSKLMSSESGQISKLRLTVAADFTKRLQDRGFDCVLLPNPNDLNPDGHHFGRLYPRKMRFICLMNGKRHTPPDVVSINQSPADLEWTINATLPSLIDAIEYYGFVDKLIRVYQQFHFEPNDEITRNQLKEIIINLTRTDKRITAVRVCCDETNNPPIVNDLICDVEWTATSSNDPRQRSFRLSSKYFEK